MSTRLAVLASPPAGSSATRSGSSSCSSSSRSSSRSSCWPHRIGRQAGAIDASLGESVHNTAALSQLNTTIDHATEIIAGLQRGRERLGG